MVTSLDMVSFDAMLKEHYTRDEVVNVALRDKPTLAILPKYEEMGGRLLPIPIITAFPTGRSRTFATAQTNAGPQVYKEFLLKTADDFVDVQISRKVMKASEKDVDAFVEARVAEIDGGMQALTASLSTALFRNGGAAIGQRGSVSSSTLTLKNPDDIAAWYPGMKIKASSADGTSGSLRAGTAAVVDAVDYDAGTVTSSTWGNITSFADNDYLFVEGDFGLAIKGFDAWLPATAPTSGDSFFSVDRSVDPTGLAGVRFDGSSLTITEALIRGVARIARWGGRPDKLILNPTKEADLIMALGAKAIYDVVKATDGDFGFDSLVLHTPKGKVKVLSDPDILSDRCYALQLDTWKLYSIGAVPDLFDEDGVRMLRQASADGVEVRASYYAQLGCRAPKKNGRITLV